MVVWRQYGLVAKDETTARNIKKLLVAIKALGKVILLTFKDTYEERVAILTQSVSGRILLKEIIPLNLAEIRETMRADLSNISEKEMVEAKAFISMLPKATEDLLTVSDYRTVGLGKKVVSSKVLELEEILAQATLA